ncbi:MAG: hypothetical protein WD379_02565 [Dehalococcoidia bacterium]
MIEIARRWLAAAWVVVAAVALVVLLLARPGDDAGLALPEVERIAVGDGFIEYNLCNVSVTLSPQHEGLQVLAGEASHAYFDEPFLTMGVIVDPSLERDYPQWGSRELALGLSTGPMGLSRAVLSGVLIDAEVGTVIDEVYYTPEEKVVLESILNTLRVRPDEDPAPC